MRTGSFAFSSVFKPFGLLFYVDFSHCQFVEYRTPYDYEKSLVLLSSLQLHCLHLFQTLSQSMRQADMNFEKLKTESERLEQHAKKSVNWPLWLMLILVSFTFISMILFIRIFPRLR